MNTNKNFFIFFVVISLLFLSVITTSCQEEDTIAVVKEVNKDLSIFLEEDESKKNSPEFLAKEKILLDIIVNMEDGEMVSGYTNKNGKFIPIYGDDRTIEAELIKLSEEGFITPPIVNMSFAWVLKCSGVHGRLAVICWETYEAQGAKMIKRGGNIVDVYAWIAD